MISRWAVWQRHRWLWLAPSIFLLINCLVYAFYNSRYAGTVETMERRFRTAEAELDELRQDSAELEAFLDEVERTRNGLRDLYEQRFSTEEERFTEVNREIRELARRAQLAPQAYTFDKTPLGNTGLTRQTIGFNIEASYDQLRTFINLLELSDHFLTLESVSMGEAGEDPRNPRLGVRIELSTIFDEADDARRAGAAGASR